MNASFFRNPTLFAPRPVLWSYIALEIFKAIYALTPPISEYPIPLVACIAVVFYSVPVYFILIKHITFIRIIYTSLILLLSAVNAVASMTAIFVSEVWGFALFSAVINTYFLIGGINLLFARKWHPGRLGVSS
ncbi:hypothetical protein [Oceanidesulfovibrio marinus]|uniref:Uncharacterized protein n=1 Tax=Oceanidesulfovibrio marinus TaxID=370038 RepID=A0ABX6NDU3_9BACT|nr:hypothetical protein [Oceanidesulfovibrio marinus]QJT08334.1 hypothetical protein E8L03_05050 [Oceanidesulfovibrio marinus]